MPPKALGGTPGPLGGTPPPIVRTAPPALLLYNHICNLCLKIIPKTTRKIKTINIIIRIGEIPPSPPLVPPFSMQHLSPESGQFSSISFSSSPQELLQLPFASSSHLLATSAFSQTPPTQHSSPP